MSCLTLQVGNLSLYGPFNGSPQLKATPYPLAGSYSGSFGSYGGNGALGSSFGSYSDGTGMSVTYPAAPNGQMSFLGGSLDANWLWLSASHMQGLGQGFGHSQLGMSPSGQPCSLSLGGSPSHQFPASHFQASPGSQYTTSPGTKLPNVLLFVCWQLKFTNHGWSHNLLLLHVLKLSRLWSQSFPVQCMSIFSLAFIGETLLCEGQAIPLFHTCRLQSLILFCFFLFHNFLVITF